MLNALAPPGCAAAAASPGGPGGAGTLSNWLRPGAARRLRLGRIDEPQAERAPTRAPLSAARQGLGSD